MKKEVFLAIFIGFILGLVITFGIWTANKSLQKMANQPDNTVADASIETSPTPIPDNPISNTISLTISTPEDEFLTNSNTLKVTGKTLANAVVAIMSETGEVLVQADINGLFSADVSLEGGYNLITVTATDDKGNSSTQSLTVTYTTSKI